MAQKSASWNPQDVVEPLARKCFWWSTPWPHQDHADPSPSPSSATSFHSVNHVQTTSFNRPTFTDCSCWALLSRLLLLDWRPRNKVDLIIRVLRLQTSNSCCFAAASIKAWNTNQAGLSCHVTVKTSYNDCTMLQQLWPWTNDMIGSSSVIEFWIYSIAMYSVLYSENPVRSWPRHEQLACWSQDLFEGPVSVRALLQVDLILSALMNPRPQMEEFNRMWTSRVEILTVQSWCLSELITEFECEMEQKNRLPHCRFAQIALFLTAFMNHFTSSILFRSAAIGSPPSSGPRMRTFIRTSPDKAFKVSMALSGSWFCKENASIGQENGLSIKHKLWCSPLP